MCGFPKFLQEVSAQGRVNWDSRAGVTDVVCARPPCSRTASPSLPFLSLSLSFAVHSPSGRVISRWLLVWQKGPEGAEGLLDQGEKEQKRLEGRQRLDEGSRDQCKAEEGTSKLTYFQAHAQRAEQKQWRALPPPPPAAAIHVSPPNLERRWLQQTFYSLSISLQFLGNRLNALEEHFTSTWSKFFFLFSDPWNKSQ